MPRRTKKKRRNVKKRSTKKRKYVRTASRKRKSYKRKRVVSGGQYNWGGRVAEFNSKKQKTRYHLSMLRNRTGRHPITELSVPAKMVLPLVYRTETTPFLITSQTSNNTPTGSLSVIRANSPYDPVLAVGGNQL